MRWLLNVLLLYGIKTIHSKSLITIRQPEVNTFLEKILQSDKFEELADRIAARAVKQLNDYQKMNRSGIPSINEKGVYRSRVQSSVKSKEKIKHKHSKIDVEAVLKKAVASDDLKLTYNQLKKTNGKSSRVEENEEYGNNNPNEGIAKANSQENEQFDYEKQAKDIQLDFSENIKTLSDEHFDNPFGNGETISWDKKSSKHPLKDDHSIGISGDSVGHNSESQFNEIINDNSTRTTRTEGDKQFILEDHPDYKEYHEDLVNVNASKN